MQLSLSLFSCSQVIRLVTTKQKSNPYNTIGISPEQMTLGQKLASKHLITDPKSRPSAQLHRQSSASEGESSDWTWETCSDSDPEGNFVQILKGQRLSTIGHFAIKVF